MITMNANVTELKRSGIRQFTQLAKTVDDCVMLTIGEPDFQTPDPIKAAAINALHAGQTHYAPNQGLEALREAIATFETKRGLPCKKEQILITAGATGALFTGLLGILNPGDEVIVPTPAFPLYESIITIAGARMVCLDTSRTNFQITKAALSAAMSPKTKAIILNSPNNPTGVIYSEESLANVKAAVMGKRVFVVCDNVYSLLSSRPCPDLSLDSQLREQLLLCQSFSKPYAMTGWRAGYLLGQQNMIEKLLPLSAAQNAAVPTFIQTACITALAEDTSSMAAMYERRRDYVCYRLNAMGLSFPKPEGAFYVFPDISKFGMASENFCVRLILEGKVATVPGSCFGTEGHIRISCCCSNEELKKGMDRLEGFIRSL